jgi:FAD:protein FMN transferase
MGNAFEFTAIHEDKRLTNEALAAAINEVARIEKVFTTYASDSITNLINSNAGISPVVVSDEVFGLVERAKFISTLTQGAFDLTYGSADRSMWNFDLGMKSLPPASLLKKSVHLINYEDITLDKKEQTIYLEKPGMRIGFGGIGKGYAAMQAKQVMKNIGIENGVVNAAGDMTAWGVQENNKPWTVGIADPNCKNVHFSSFALVNNSIATSGNYEKFIIVDKIKYSHTIDPKTGLPIRGIKSVSVICQSAELADAMTTPIMIMGTEVGLHLVNQLQGVEAIVVDDDNIVHTSANINTL